MKVAGINTVEAIFSSVKGDMSKLTNVIVPTFSELYENIEALDYECVTAEEAESWFN